MKSITFLTLKIIVILYGVDRFASAKIRMLNAGIYLCTVVFFKWASLRLRRLRPTLVLHSIEKKLIQRRLYVKVSCC